MYSTTNARIVEIYSEYSVSPAPPRADTFLLELDNGDCVRCGTMLSGTERMHVHEHAEDYLDEGWAVIRHLGEADDGELILPIVQSVHDRHTPRPTSDRCVLPRNPNIPKTFDNPTEPRYPSVFNYTYPPDFGIGVS